MIAHISPASSAFEESRNTLTYAGRAKNIKTRVRALPGGIPATPPHSLAPATVALASFPSPMSPHALPHTLNTCVPAGKRTAPEGPRLLVQGHVPPAPIPFHLHFRLQMPVQTFTFSKPVT